MVDLKKYNYFTGDKSSVATGVSYIVNFLDLAGYNYVLFTLPRTDDNHKYYEHCLYHHLSNKIEFTNLEDFKEKILDKSNLFRVDIVILDFWSRKRMYWEPYLELLKNLPQNFIIATKEFEYKSTDDVNDFLVRNEYKDLHKIDIWLTDRITGESSTLETLKRSYIRNKKIDHLFGDE